MTWWQGLLVGIGGILLLDVALFGWLTIQGRSALSRRPDPPRADPEFKL